MSQLILTDRRATLATESGHSMTPYEPETDRYITAGADMIPVDPDYKTSEIPYHSLRKFGGKVSVTGSS